MIGSLALRTRSAIYRLRAQINVTESTHIPIDKTLLAKGDFGGSPKGEYQRGKFLFSIILFDLDKCSALSVLPKGVI